MVGAVVLVLWAAVAGPGTVLEGEGRDRVTLSDPTPTSESVEAGSGEQMLPSEETRDVPTWLRAVVRAVLLVLEVAVVVAFAWVLWRAGRWAWQRWDARDRPAGPATSLTGAEEVLDTEALTEELLRGAAGRRARLDLRTQAGVDALEEPVLVERLREHLRSWPDRDTPARYSPWWRGSEDQGSWPAPRESPRSRPHPAESGP